jgi:energy-coupling factor transport system permease protein
VPVLALVGGGVALAFTTDHPLVMAVLALGAVVLLALAGHTGGRLLVVAGVVSAIGMVVLTPFVAAQGDLILVEGPALPIVDTQVTLEEVVTGLVLGLRLATVTLLLGAGLAIVDQDRLLDAAMRLAPGSALTAALAARSLPALERDARALAETARGRGAWIGGGGWTRRARASAPLVVPLLGSSLERSLDVAEAMTVRGYGSGSRTRRRPSAATGLEWALGAAGVLLGALAVAAAFGLAAYDAYPRLGDVLTVSGVVVAALTGAALAAAAALVRAR